MSGLLPGARAQEPLDPEEWLRIDVVQVLPDRVDEFLELQRDAVNPALREAGVPWRSSWVTAEFGNTYERLFVSPISNLDEYDTGGPLGRSLPSDRVERLRAGIRRCVAGRQSYAVRYRPELSVELEDVSQLPLARMTVLEIAPGRTAAWVAFIEARLARFREAGAVFGVYERLLGPGPTTWLVVENFRSFAELDQPNLLGPAFGENALSEPATLAGVLGSVERTVLRYEPDLSYGSISVLP